MRKRSGCMCLKLVIITHPDIENSVVNKAWTKVLKTHSNHFAIHSLYEQYPDLNFDLRAEQNLLSAYEEIIFQFPIHWFSTLFALKKYIDEVFTYGWAFGPEGDQLYGKKIGFAVSTGGSQESYDGPRGISVAHLLNDFQLTFQYCGCEITQMHVFHGAMARPTEDLIAGDAQKYIQAFMPVVA